MVPVGIGGGSGSRHRQGLIPIGAGGGGGDPEGGGPALISLIREGGGIDALVLLEEVEGSAEDLTTPGSASNAGASLAIDKLAILDSTVMWLIPTDGTSTFWPGLVLKDKVSNFSLLIEFPKPKGIGEEPESPKVITIRINSIL